MTTNPDGGAPGLPPETAHVIVVRGSMRGPAPDDTVDADTVMADPDQLAQVFRNLLSNALTYSGDAPPTVSVTAEHADGAWRIAVADEGIGIDPDHHERIFNSFQRLHTHDEDPGSGVGLALCERIIERHGGEIWVESKPGDGATFYFTLPPANAEQERPTTAEDEPVA